MLAKLTVGRRASVVKYDLITALGAHGLASGPTRQRLVLRLITLLTARYDWQRQELCVGQREIARLWSVTDRTVKRDIAALRRLGWLTILQHGARGRVARYRLVLDAIWADTTEAWSTVGPDFETRMADMMAGDNGAGEDARKIVPLPVATPSEPADEPWASIHRRLAESDPHMTSNWFTHLGCKAFDGNRLTLIAPNAFIAKYVATHLTQKLYHAARAEIGPSLIAVTVSEGG